MAGTILTAGVVDGAEQERPNIVYINVDDLGWADLSCQGSKFYETPNIDKLASESMVFTDAYAPAANCAPSRACCLTGQYQPRHGIYTVGNSDRGKSEHRKLIPTKNTLSIKKDNQTIGGALQEAGYKTITVGKWHISEDPCQNGFDVNVAGSHWGHPHHGYFSPYRNPAIKDGPKGEYLPNRLTSEAMKLIEQQQGKGPFFLYMPFYVVHTPIEAPSEITKKYRAKKGTRAHNNAKYAAMVEVMDKNVGRLMETLERLGMKENTLVLFTSDNGGVWQISKQWPLRAGKGAYYEGGIREPLFVRWPGKVKAGSKCSVPVSGIDFFPTFLEAAKAKAKPGKVLDGVSLVPLLTGKAEKLDRNLYWHFPVYLQGGNKETRDSLFRTRPGSVVRSGKWKLHEYFEDGGLELYDLSKDVSEKHNLVDQYPEIARKLHEDLKAWRKKMEAPVPSRLNPKYKAKVRKKGLALVD